MTTYFTSLSPEQFIQFRTSYRKLAATKTLTSSMHAILNNVLRGLDSKRGFTPITNTVKLSNGATAWVGYQQALYALRGQLSYRSSNLRAMYGDWLTSEVVESLLRDVNELIRATK